MELIASPPEETYADDLIPPPREETVRRHKAQVSAWSSPDIMDRHPDIFTPDQPGRGSGDEGVNKYVELATENYKKAMARELVDQQAQKYGSEFEKYKGWTELADKATPPGGLEEFQKTVRDAARARLLENHISYREQQWNSDYKRRFFGSLRTKVPVIGGVIGAITGKGPDAVAASMEAIKNGNATADDYDRVSEHHVKNSAEQGAGPLSQAALAGAGLAKFGVELWAAGKTGLPGKIGEATKVGFEGGKVLQKVTGALGSGIGYTLGMAPTIQERAAEEGIPHIGVDPQTKQFVFTKPDSYAHRLAKETASQYIDNVIFPLLGTETPYITSVMGAVNNFGLKLLEGYGAQELSTLVKDGLGLIDHHSPLFDLVFGTDPNGRMSAWKRTMEELAVSGFFSAAHTAWNVRRPVNLEIPEPGLLGGPPPQPSAGPKPGPQPSAGPKPGPQPSAGPKPGSNGRREQGGGQNREQQDRRRREQEHRQRRDTRDTINDFFEQELDKEFARQVASGTPKDVANRMRTAKILRDKERIARKNGDEHNATIFATWAERLEKNNAHGPTSQHVKQAETEIKRSGQKVDKEAFDEAVKAATEEANNAAKTTTPTAPTPDQAGAPLAPVGPAEATIAPNGRPAQAAANPPIGSEDRPTLSANQARQTPQVPVAPVEVAQVLRPEAARPPEPNRPAQPTAPGEVGGTQGGPGLASATGLSAGKSSGLKSKVLAEILAFGNEEDMHASLDRIVKPDELWNMFFESEYPKLNPEEKTAVEKVISVEWGGLRPGGVVGTITGGFEITARDWQDMNPWEDYRTFGDMIHEGDSTKSMRGLAAFMADKLGIGEQASIPEHAKPKQIATTVPAGEPGGVEWTKADMLAEADLGPGRSRPASFKTVDRTKLKFKETPPEDGASEVKVSHDGKRAGGITVKPDSPSAAKRMFPNDVPEGATVMRVGHIEVKDKLQGHGIGQELYLRAYSQYPEGTLFWNSATDPPALPTLRRLAAKGLIDLKTSTRGSAESHLAKLTEKGRSVADALRDRGVQNAPAFVPTPEKSTGKVDTAPVVEGPTHAVVVSSFRRPAKVVFWGTKDQAQKELQRLHDDKSTPLTASFYVVDSDFVKKEGYGGLEKPRQSDAPVVEGKSDGTKKTTELTPQEEFAHTELVVNKRSTRWAKSAEGKKAMKAAFGKAYSHTTLWNWAKSALAKKGMGETTAFKETEAEAQTEKAQRSEVLRGENQPEPERFVPGGKADPRQTKESFGEGAGFSKGGVEQDALDVKADAVLQKLQDAIQEGNITDDHKERLLSLYSNITQQIEAERRGLTAAARRHAAEVRRLEAEEKELGRKESKAQKPSQRGEVIEGEFPSSVIDPGEARRVSELPDIVRPPSVQDAQEAVVDLAKKATADFNKDQAGSLYPVEFLKGVEDAWQDIRQISGVIAPRTTNADREAGEALAHWGNSEEYGRAATPVWQAKVLGDKLKDKNFDLVLGAYVTEHRLRYMKLVAYPEYAKRARADAAKARAAGNHAAAAQYDSEADEALEIAGNVSSVIGQPGSPFATFSDYQAAHFDARVQQAANIFFGDFAKQFPERNFRRAQGLGVTDPINSFTQVPKKPMNLKGMTEEEMKKGASKTVVTGRSTGNPKNLKVRNLVFANQAKGNADGYDISSKNIIENSIVKSESVASKAEFVRIVDKNKLIGHLGESNDRQEGYTELPYLSPPKGTQSVTGQNVSLYVRDRFANEVRRVFNIDASVMKAGGTLTKVVKAFNTTATVGSMLSFGEAEAHIINYLRTAFAAGSRPWDIPINFIQLFRNNQDYHDRLLDLVRIAARFPHQSSAGPIISRLPEKLQKIKYALPLTLSSKVLNKFDDVCRLSMEDAFNRLAKAGKVPNTETAKRDMINTTLGNYNQLLMYPGLALLRESGIQPFSVATATAASASIRAIAGSPGVHATSYKAALELRGSMFARYLAAVSLVMVWNYLKTGEVFPEGIPLFAMHTGTRNGKPTWFPTNKMIPPVRGLSQLGVTQAIEAQREGKKGAGAREVITGLGNTLLHQVAGPGPSFVQTALTGTVPHLHTKKEYGATRIGFLDVAEKAKEGESVYAKNFKAALLGINSFAASYWESRGKTTPSEKYLELLGPWNPYQHKRSKAAPEYTPLPVQSAKSDGRK